MKKKYLIALFILIIVLSLSIFTKNNVDYFTEKISIKNNPLPIIGNLTLYDYYHNLERAYTEDYSLYILNPFDDKYIYDYFKNMNFEEALIFCRNISYESESIGEEYPKYPVETLFDNCGDCEDKSILCASILYSKGFNVSLVRFDNHMMILIDDLLIETTDNNNNIYTLDDAKDIYPIDTHPILVLNWNATIYKYKGNNFFADLDILVFNYGNILGCTIIRIFDNVTFYDYPIYVDAFSVSYIDLGLKILSNNLEVSLYES